ncbi:hypothetical protein H7827_14670 [Streptomyces sp. JH002]|uniref:hypothetical protein n=1 Tax=Streptomyces sp. JH002 TaxID=2763259 RepID=UPI003D808706
MHDLLSGQQALRGRATLDLRPSPLGFRAARRSWDIEDLHTAFLVDAVCGGVPGCQVLAEHDTPQHPAGFDAFAANGLLTPGHPLYSRTETEYLLREDPRLDQRSASYPLLGAMVGGATTPTEIGARIGKERSTTAHALEVLEAAGYARRDRDLLKKRSLSQLVPDPVIRFNQAPPAPGTKSTSLSSAPANPPVRPTAPSGWSARPRRPPDRAAPRTSTASNTSAPSSPGRATTRKARSSRSSPSTVSGPTWKPSPPTATMSS